MVEIEERIEVLKREILEVKKQRSLDRVEQQNSLLKLREEYHEKLCKIHSVMDSLGRKKKQQHGDMKQYRETITNVFSEMYLPAYCVAKQAFLLRAVHTSKSHSHLRRLYSELMDYAYVSVMCFDQALFLLSQQCAEALKDFDRVINGLQEDTAKISQELLSRLLLIERHIHQCEEGMAEAANRVEMISNTKLHRISSEEALDDVPLGDDSLDRSTNIVVSSKRNTPKRDVSSDRTLDTVSLSYVETSSFDERGYDLSPLRQMQSVPRFVG